MRRNEFFRRADMGKLVAIGEAIIVIKEVWDSASDIFIEFVPDNFYKSMDDFAFLNSKFLSISSNGHFLDGTEKIADAVLNLSNLVIWIVLLFYGFRSLFGYFLSKKVDIPWKFFIRMIVFGILANSAFFICYSGVFFTENITEYIREYVGKNNSSFCVFDEYIDSDVMENSEEDGESSIYTIEALMSIFAYFSSIFFIICLGGRYILIKVLILTSPIFFIIGGVRGDEKIFYKWCKAFFVLLSMQIFICVIISVFNLANIGNELYSQVAICAILLVLCRNIFKFLILPF